LNITPIPGSRIENRIVTLVVEPSEQTLAFLEFTLRSRGHRVVGCRNSAAAMEACKREKFQLALLDWNACHSSGIELCREIRALPHGLDTMILVCTEKAEPDALRLILNTGADDYLAKPFNDDFLSLRLNIAEQRARCRQEHRTLEERLRQSQKMEAIGRFAGGIAHDFNNLLTVIMGRTDLLLRMPVPQDRLQPNLQEISKTATRAAQLTRQLLAFSRQQVLQPEVLNLNAIVSDIDSMLQRLIGEDVSILKIFDHSLGRIKADASQIQQVIMNLALNARDAMPNGGVLTIETENVELTKSENFPDGEMPPGQYILLMVTDTGVGMDSATQSRIFEPFFTTKDPGKGTGLGLSTVYGIVKQSGGHITVITQPNKGASFRLYFPRIDPVPQTLQRERTQPPMNDGNGIETVLLVEEEPPILNLMSEVLAEQGYQVLKAHSPAEAVRLCKQHPSPINVVFTDVNSPDGHGMALIERIRGIRPAIKALLTSGYTGDALLEQRVHDREIMFLQKPFTPDQLLKNIQTLLGAPRTAVAEMWPAGM